MSAGRALVVSDQAGIRELFAASLAPLCAVTSVGRLPGALALLTERTFDVVIADLQAPGGAALRLLREVKSRSPISEVILLTSHRAVAQAREALDLGAYAFVVKPFRAADAARVVARALERRQLRAELTRLRREVEDLHAVDRLVAESPRMRTVQARVIQAAEGSAPVLLQGEGGTGKELLARAIHYRSARRAGPFAAVYCGALEAGGCEERLFGTAAPGSGLLASADGGTVFLDEVGALPAPAQERLSRVLLARRGGAGRRPGPPGPDVRFIAASRLDLAEESRGGRFRRDLLRLLREHTIAVPALRDRREDIPVLAARFLERCRRRSSQPLGGFDGAALQALAAYRWPGNCRELELAVERAAALSAGPLVRAADLPPEVLGDRSGTTPEGPSIDLPYREAVDLVAERASREYLIALMASSRGNVSAAARRARLQRETLHRLLARHGLRSEAFRQDG